MTFQELSKLWDETEKVLADISNAIEQAWEDGDKSHAKSLECGSDQYWDILFEIEEELENIIKKQLTLV